MSAIPLRKIEGKYEILEKFREGGMGAIYKVRHRLLDEVRVIKMMRPQLVEDEELKGRFLREARLAIKLRHPNVAQLYDFTVDEEDGTAFIVMEFINGMTLEDVVKSSGPPPLGLAVEMAQQSLRALGYLHGKGLIHRDISPDNLMLTEDTDGNPLMKLIDLGIAKALVGGEGKGTATGIYLGKVRYSSPEQFGFEGSAPLDSRGDLYSFGIVFCELLTGRYPIQGRDPSSIIAGHLFRPPLDFAEIDPQGRVPEGLRQLVLSCLAKSPGERPQSAQELSRALAAFRGPSDLTPKDLAQVLRRSDGDTAGASFPEFVTTTQSRLDEHFGMGRTPPPEKLAAPPQGRPAPQVVVPLRPVEPAGSRTRESEATAAVAEIEAVLARGDYRKAEVLLYAAEASHGALESLPGFHERVAALRRLDLVTQAAERVANARRLAAAGTPDALDAAREDLKRAQRLDPENADVAEVLAEIEEAVRSREVAKKRAEKLAAAVERIGEALDRGDLEASGQLLDRSVVVFGAVEPLRELWLRREELLRRTAGS